jgi:hypothetical protein
MKENARNVILIVKLAGGMEAIAFLVMKIIL